MASGVESTADTSVSGARLNLSDHAAVAQATMSTTSTTITPTNATTNNNNIVAKSYHTCNGKAFQNTLNGKLLAALDNLLEQSKDVVNSVSPSKYCS